MYVGDELTGGEPGSPRYAFVRYIRQWAGVHGRTDAESARDKDAVAKIQKFWALNQPQLQCTQLGFSVRNGSIWKLAIERNSEDFLETALIDWKLSPNALDCTGESPLDYIDRELTLDQGTTRPRTLRRHRDLLLEYGAKKARDFSPQERLSAPAGCR